MKEYYVKCASNEQAQELRPYLVQVEWRDNKWWNNGKKDKMDIFICFYNDGSFDILNHEPVTRDLPLLHTVPDDADLAETAKVIKELFDKL